MAQAMPPNPDKSTTVYGAIVFSGGRNEALVMLARLAQMDAVGAKWTRYKTVAGALLPVVQSYPTPRVVVEDYSMSITATRQLLDSLNPHPVTATAVRARVQELRLPIDICMLSCNRRRITEISIRAIHVRTTTPHRLLVLDNGSVDGSDELIKALAAEGLVDGYELAPENSGVHWGHNSLLDWVESDLYVCCDNDLVPCVPVDDKDWLSRLSDLMDRNPKYGAIACRPHVLIGEPGNRFADSPEIRDMHHVGAHLRLMRTALVRKVGGWERGVRPSRNHEERHICGLIKKAGFKIGYARDIRCIHQFGDSDLGEDPWGYTEGTYHEGHREIWPPANHYDWKRMKIDWETCGPEKGK